MKIKTKRIIILAIFSIFFISIILTSYQIFRYSQNVKTPTDAPPIKHIIFIAFENKNYDSVVTAGPYFKYLADTYGRATQAYDIHNICSGESHSLPSYLTVTSGSPFNKCDTDNFTAGEFDSKNIFSLVNDAGMTWAQYAEGMSYPCSTKGTKFAARHVPALFYRNILQNSDTAYCKNHVVPLTDWYNMTNSGQIPPNFAFISPDLCNDAHDCSVSTADNWLKNSFNLPDLLTKSWAQNTAFFIWFDEGYGQPGYFVVVSPYSKGRQHIGIVSNYNVLTTMEWLLGLDSSGNNDDANKNSPIKDLFGQ